MLCYLYITHYYSTTSSLDGVLLPSKATNSEHAQIDNDDWNSREQTEADDNDINDYDNVEYSRENSSEWERGDQKNINISVADSNISNRNSDYSLRDHSRAKELAVSFMSKMTLIEIKVSVNERIMNRGTSCVISITYCG